MAASFIDLTPSFPPRFFDKTCQNASKSGLFPTRGASDDVRSLLPGINGCNGSRGSYSGGYLVALQLFLMRLVTSNMAANQTKQTTAKSKSARRLMFDSPESAALWFNIFNAVLLAGALLVAVGTWGTIKTAGIKERYSDERIAANEAETKHAVADSDAAREGTAKANQRIAELNKETARLSLEGESARAAIAGANERASALETDAAKARERTAALEKETAEAKAGIAAADARAAEANARTKEAEENLERLRLQTGPRMLDRVKLKEALSKAKVKAEVQLKFAKDQSEPWWFASQIFSALLDLDWRVSWPTPIEPDDNPPHSIPGTPPMSGLLLISNNQVDLNDRTTPLGALVFGLAASAMTAHIATDPRVPDGVVKIMVSSRTLLLFPPPKAAPQQ